MLAMLGPCWGHAGVMWDWDDWAIAKGQMQRQWALGNGWCVP